MRLAKLTLNGFKSFADKTELTFDDDITCVVGPNGCGKSNVVDAVKWVLGERSSKSLRGKEMIDVIFAGSAARKPSGLAQVVLSFDNPVVDEQASMDELVIDTNPSADPSDTAATERRATTGRRALPIDADEVHVERRLYRDGTSQYLINDRRVRLRDVRELFLDTGVGADAYSIIEQGKVDAMLLASPQERRTIFEEAAGVAKYKQRRIEAVRKLERTEVNLTRAREQLDATERRLRLVKGQAAKARRFVSLDEEHRAIRAALAFDQYDDLCQRLNGLTSRLSKLENERAEAEAAVRELEVAKSDADIDLAEHDKALKALERDQLARQHEQQQQTQRADMTERSIAQAQQRIERDRATLRDAEEKSDELTQVEQEQRERVAEIEERLGSSERELTTAGESRAAVLERLAELRGRAGEARTAAANIARERASLEAGIDADARRLETLHEQRRSIEAKQATAHDELTAAARSLDSAGDALDRDRDQLDTEARSLAAVITRYEALATDRGQRSATLAEQEQLLVRLESRRATLQEMIESREGFADAVKHVLEQRDAGDAAFAAVRGALAELIETDTDDAPALEAALGDTLGALVVPSLSELDTHAELAGRVTFLPETVAGDPLQATNEPATGEPTPNLDVDATGGRVVRLRSAVRAADARIGALLDRLLGTTYVVESLDAAVLLGAGPLGRSARFVTRRGELLEADGRVVLGPLGESPTAGVLGRRAELADLTQEIQSLAEVVRRDRAELARVDAEAADLADRRQSLQTEHARLEREIASRTAEHDRLEREIARLTATTGTLSDEAASVGERVTTIEDERASARTRVEKLAALENEQAALAAEHDAGLTSAEAEAESAGEALAAAKVRAGQQREQLAAAGRDLDRTRRELEQCQRQSESLARHIDDALSAVSAELAAAQEARSLAETAAKAAEALTFKIGEAGLALTETATRSAELGERLGSARQSMDVVQRDWHAVESSRRELEIRREHLEDQVLADLGIDLAVEHLDYRATIAPGDVTLLEREPAEARAAELAREIKTLGNVNLDAMEEEGQLAERNEDLVAQVADLDEARGQLEGLIEKLNVTSEALFKETFEIVREHFAAPDGMFRKLFGGGKAEVRLMPLIKEIDGEKVQTDEIDWLESGVEVIARPPGKEPRTINQLSGGEKTMTAVALLLSIFKSKPSCFCVLDEVDAALDDANVERYCRVVREFTDRSHFIVITHNKRTMAEGDRLYGITMQEHGVSKRVSVRVDDIRDDGSITETAANEQPGWREPSKKALLAGLREHETVASE
ncbi:MAG: chromosome segregation protein SMC [Planctomycetota bacterium]